MKNILTKIRNWWNGRIESPGSSNFFAITTERHWTSKIAHKIANFHLKEWKFLLTILLTILNFMYTYSIKQTTNKTDEKYQSCKIQQDDKNVIAVICLK